MVKIPSSWPPHSKKGINRGREEGIGVGTKIEGETHEGKVRELYLGKKKALFRLQRMSSAT